MSNVWGNGLDPSTIEIKMGFPVQGIKSAD